ncbi:MAG TPA: L-type lectin-domain containing protein, partial [Silvibacterium sp.]|nr:L-type lectin-domain containing protein [Silvibacterium sp.]
NGGIGQEGTAWFATPVNVQSFTTNFTFQLTNATADGFTFAIQNKGTTAKGSFGVGLGYQGIPTSVAVKFDLFNNSGEGVDSTGLYTNGAIPTVPATDLSSTGINLHSGDIMAVQLVYDGTNLTMTITDTVTKASYSTTFAINIPATVGGNTAYVGFTGGTGVLSATQQILTWSYTN